MKPKLVLLTTEYLRDYVKTSVEDMKLYFDYDIILYQSFDEIPEIYKNIPESIKGVITSGDFPYRIIKKSFPGTQRVVRAFNTDDAGIYKVFLEIFKKYNTIDSRRIFADILDVIGITNEDYLFKEQKYSYLEMLQEAMADISLTELIETEKNYQKQHLDYWKNNQIDISITRFSSIAYSLQKEGLPVYFAYPSAEYLKNVCLHAIKDAQIHDLQDNQTSVINISQHNYENLSTDIVKENIAIMFDIMQNFNTKYMLDLVIQKHKNHLEIFTNKKVIERLTDGFISSEVHNHMHRFVDFNTCVGYGIGTTLYQARLNASDANREAQLLIAGGSSLVNELDQLISPLESKKTIIVSRENSPLISKAAKLSGISSLTVQKVLTAASTMENNQITSQDLASKLSITQRSANRFLSALYKSGFAEIVHERRGTTKGRPERVYQILINES